VPSRDPAEEHSEASFRVSGLVRETRPRRPMSRLSRAYSVPAGQSRGRATVGDGIDWRAGASGTRGRRSRFRFGASQPRILRGAEGPFDVGEARRADARSRGGRRRGGENSALADAYEKARPRRPMLRLASLRRAGQSAGSRRKATESPAAPAAQPSAAAGSRGFGSAGPVRGRVSTCAVTPLRPRK